MVLEKVHSMVRNVKSPRLQRDNVLHPLIHTSLKFNLAQDMVSFQCEEKKTPIDTALTKADGGTIGEMVCGKEAPSDPTHFTLPLYGVIHKKQI